MADVKITTNREIERRLVRIRERIADNLKNRLLCKTLSCLHCYSLGKQDYSVVRSSITSHYKSAEHRFFSKDDKVQVCLCARYFWANGPLDDLFFLKHVFDCLLQRPLPLGIQTLIRQAKSIIFVVNSTNKCDRRNSFLDETPFPKPPSKTCRPLSEFQLQPFQQPFGELRQNHVSRADTDRGETSTAAADSCGEREQASGADRTPVSDGNAASGTAGTSAPADTSDQSEVRDNTTAAGAGDNATTAGGVSVVNDNAVDNAEPCEATTTFENVFEQNEEESERRNELAITENAGSKSRLRNSIFFKMLTKVLNKNHFTNLDLLKLNLLKRKYNNERLKQRALYMEERNVYRHFSRFFCNYVKTKNCKTTILCVLCKPPIEVSVLHFMTHNLHHMRLCANQEIRCCCKCGSYFFMHTDSNYCPNYLEHICKCVTGETFLNDEYFLQHFLRRNVVNQETEQLKGELKERTREVETLRAENDLLRYDNAELKREIEARAASKREDHLMANMLLDMSASSSCCMQPPLPPLSESSVMLSRETMPRESVQLSRGTSESSVMPRESVQLSRGTSESSVMPRENVQLSSSVMPRESMQLSRESSVMPRETREVQTMTSTLFDMPVASTSGCFGGCSVDGCMPSTSAMPAMSGTNTLLGACSACMPREVRGEDHTMSASIPRDHHTMSNTLIDMSVRNEEDHTMANTLLDMSVSGSVSGCTSSMPRDVNRVELLDMSTGGRREMVATDLDMFNNYAQQTDTYSAGYAAESPLNYTADYAPPPAPPPLLTPLMYEVADEKPERRSDASVEALRHRSFFAPRRPIHPAPVVRSIQSYPPSYLTKSSSSSVSISASSTSKSKSDAFATLSVLSELLSPIPLSASSSSSSLSSSTSTSLGTKRKADDNQGTKLVKKNK